MKQTSIGSFVKRLPPPKAPPSSFLVLYAVKKAILRGHAFLFGVSEELVVPKTHGVVTYYGEQQFSYMATGKFKAADSRKGQQIYVPLAKQGFDVLVPDIKQNRVYRVEVKTIFKGAIIALSAQQQVVADVIAIYNPRTVMQSIVFRDVSYDVPAKSYAVISLQ